MPKYESFEGINRVLHRNEISDEYLVGLLSEVQDFLELYVPYDDENSSQIMSDLFGTYMCLKYGETDFYVEDDE